MKVRYTDAALREVDEILSYIAKDNPLAADEVAALLQVTVRRIANYPQLATETDDSPVRVAPVLPYRYLIFYTVDLEGIVIRNVSHSARQGQL
jgi:toxin ParE1/3/4